MLSFVSWLTLSGTEQSSVRGPSTENQEAKRVALDCIKVTTCLPLVNNPGPLPDGQLLPCELKNRIIDDL